MEIAKKRIKHILLFFVILSLMMVTLLPLTAQADSYNMIRVQLLSGKSDYENLLTASSNDGFTIVNTTGLAGQFTYNASSNERVGLQLDRYSLLVKETNNRQEANNIVERLKLVKASKLNPVIEVAQVNEQNKYRVTVGSFDSVAEANDLRRVIAAEQQLSSMVIGNQHWVGGNYGSLEEASQMAAQLNSAGYLAYPGQYMHGDTNYYLYIGDSADVSEHNQLRAEVESRYGLSLSEPISDSYVIYKEFARVSGSTLNKYKLFTFSKNSKVKLTNRSENSAIQIDERLYQGNSLRYHGELNLQLHNGNMVIVNFLPLETYLYSVEGSEMYNGWPLEAHKAQAVTARTFAYQRLVNPRNAIADIYDTTDDQAYFGIDKESSISIRAVDETSGLVIHYNGNTFTAFYSANAGGMNAHGTELWGNDVPFTYVQESPWDVLAESNANDWYRIILPSGVTGYVRSDFITLSGSENELGLKRGNLNGTNVNMRTGPSTIYCSVKMVLDIGQSVMVLETVKENNAYSWITDPITPAYLLDRINQYQEPSGATVTTPVLDLKVVATGPSGRVMQLANGNRVIPVKYPDYYRTMLGSTATGVLSNFFEIEQTGRVDVLAARGDKISTANASNQLYVVSANGVSSLSAINNSQDEYLLLNGDGEIRVASKEQQYVLHGKGWGHGIGMSQWGAKGMAEEGYTFRDILEYYYKGIKFKQLY